MKSGIGRPVVASIVPGQQHEIDTGADAPRECCGVCDIILDAMLSARDLGNNQTWELGGGSEILNSSECEAHNAFFGSFLHAEPNHDSRSMSICLYKGRVFLYVTRTGKDGQRWTSSPEEFLLLQPSAGTQGVCMGRSVDRNYVSTNLIRQWMSYCEDNHGSACSSAGRRPSMSISWFVDTETNCLVPAPEGSRYVALSYVWGKVPMLKALKANVLALQKPGALSREFAAEIPSTIRHAMSLVRSLGERYLWVDSLCIVQDDEESFRLHIRHMASIFEAAALTVVAADGTDANYGLHGLRNTSVARSLPPVLPLGEQIGITTRLCGLVRRSAWATRGWTLQEHLFSRRMLVFIDGSVRWFCCENTYYEDVDSPLDIDPSTTGFDGGDHAEGRSLQELSLNYPDLSRLVNLLADYGGRLLTYEQDVIPAILSTFQALNRAFPRGFIHGLPVSFLDATLIWRRRGSPLKLRRSPSDSQDGWPPSWTWAGWKGRIHSLCWTSKNYIKNPTFNMATAHWKPYQAIPFLKWHTCSAVNSEQRQIQHQNEWHEFKVSYMGKADGLPPGWHYQREGMEAQGEESEKPYQDMSRFRDPLCPVDSEADLQTPYFYTHDSSPGIKFWHPVPIGRGDAESTLPQAGYGRYLCAKTQQARLWAARPPQNCSFPLAVSYQGPDRFVAPLFSTVLGVEIVLRDGAGSDVGELSIDGVDDLEHVKGYEAVEGESGYACDLVAISRGFDFAEPMVPERETYTFYNVLWVVWIDGVAYRRGVGRVIRGTWEGLQREDIGLILG
ncbi:heterokaryon incompatibility protein [Phialemonium atrogriseum]|uniref:Heterokaryon incompatibility protein n=1 Tax=Phialemonium atrogriseum TaxID=1093897 RepID=A0AAJ0FGA1_9PEZI|nr:heterokaryon incompatibility protein [Phialemonium atrogriseum]KAK1762163.1 heterokaryon incompatibility protein [Phialemonium atrogriseum]